MPNAIPALQNEESQLALLRARQETYAGASTLLVWQLLLTVVVPVLSAVVALLLPPIRPYTAAAALLIGILDTVLLDRLQRQKLKLAAKFSEMFDEKVLAIPWNRFVAGKRPDPETIHAAAEAWRRRKNDDGIVDWYPVIVAIAPLYLARIICQRTNLWYDATLRRNYANWVCGAAATLVALLFLGALAVGLTVDLFVTTVLAPAAPLLNWAMREYFRQKDTAEAQETLKSDAEALWDRAKSGGCGESECETQAREFQNAIFTRRGSSPLILPMLYPRRRPAMEQQMNVGAAEYLKEIGIDA